MTNLVFNAGYAGGAKTLSDNWATPVRIFNKLNYIFQYTCDAAASEVNHKLPLYWTKETNALRQEWSGHRIFCNPPFSMKEEFLEKAWNSYFGGTLSTILLPADSGTEWFHNYAEEATVTFLIKGRIQYEPPPGVILVDKKGKPKKSSNSKPSSLFVFSNKFLDKGGISLLDLNDQEQLDYWREMFS